MYGNISPGIRLVWIKNVGMKPAYVCDSCGLGYRDARMAFECESFCKGHKSCSQELAKKAVYRP
jgi:hypothetical protein